MARDDLPKRFYKQAGGRRARRRVRALTLDGRPARTPAKRPARFADARLWRSRGGGVERARRAHRSGDHAADPHRQFRDRRRRAGHGGRCRGNRRLCRAPTCCATAPRAPKTLFGASRDAWDPVLDWARDELGSPLNHVNGIVFAAQPSESLGRTRCGGSKLRSSPARRAPCDHHVNRLGPAGFGGRAGVVWSRRRPGRRLISTKTTRSSAGERTKRRPRDAPARWREMEAAARILDLLGS